VPNIPKLYRRLFNMLLLICISMVSNAQHADLVLHFIPTFHGKELAMDKYYQLPNGDSISFSTFKCYISGIELLGNDTKHILRLDTNGYHLLNAEEPATMNIRLHEIPKYSGIQYNVGVDSSMSVSGAMGGDLDPEKGMYWAWQSGYINFKIEGKNNKVPNRNHEFQYHVGGYAGKDKAIQTLASIIEASNEQTIYIQLDKFLSGLDMSKQYSVMIPGQEAVELAKKIASCFELRK